METASMGRYLMSTDDNDSTIYCRSGNVRVVGIFT